VGRPQGLSPVQPATPHLVVFNAVKYSLPHVGREKEALRAPSFRPGGEKILARKIRSVKGLTAIP